MPLTSDAGNFALAWEADEPVRVELRGTGGQMRPSVVYEGLNHSAFVSGLPDGKYEVRLLDRSGNIAEAVELTVTHQSISRALWLVALGALAFIATIVVIARGARDE